MVSYIYIYTTKSITQQVCTKNHMQLKLQFYKPLKISLKNLIFSSIIFTFILFTDNTS
uniref:Uncharacterized protein n=1 Tax=Heterorhabditis bacteriophora TaxID=37862 RepID=A0A1I7WUT5_HETBA